MRRLTNWMLGTAMCLGASAMVQGAYITNGDFESAPNADSASNTFTAWSETLGTSGSAGATAVRAAVPLSGSVSARLVTDQGSMTQTVTALKQYQFDIDFAMPDPLGTGNRALSVFLISRNSANTADGQINLRVVTGTLAGKGSLQSFNGTAWVNLLANSVNLSTDLSSPVTNHLTVNGNYTSGSSYTATVNGTTSSSSSAFQNNVPVSLHTVTLSSDFSQVDWVADNITLTGTELPEPGSLTLIAVGLAPLLGRRRRQI